MIRKKIVRLLRKFRVLHRWFGITLAIFLLISAITGVLLSLKKDVDVLQPPTQKGQSVDLEQWKSLAELETIAYQAAEKAYPNQKNEVGRIDARPDKGIVKVIFKKENLEIQLDGATGEVLSMAPRWSDFIESIHDGSIIGDVFKVISMNAIGWGVVLMALSGFWLWYGPRRLRKKRRNKKT